MISVVAALAPPWIRPARRAGADSESNVTDLAHMTKSDIVDRIAAGTGLTKLETEAVVDGFLKTVAEALCHDEHVELRGFGTFRVKERAPRIGRNPRTGENVSLDTQFVPHFKVSRELRQLVDTAIKSLKSESEEDAPQ